MHPIGGLPDLLDRAYHRFQSCLGIPVRHHGNSRLEQYATGSIDNAGSNFGASDVHA
jgi:hypothetical protein